jgi:hypothetical protein
MVQQNSATTSTTSPSSYLLKIAEKKKNIKQKNLLALFPNSTSYLAFHHPATQISIQCYSSLYHP